MSTSVKQACRQSMVAILLLLGVFPCALRAEERVSLETLWKDYQAYGLPTPPADARLAILPSGNVSFLNGVRYEDHFLVLLIRPNKGKERAVYWEGCDPGRAWQGMRFRPVAPEDVQLDKTTTLVDTGGRERFPTYPDLALAIQCYAKGWNKLAEALLERQRRGPKPNPFPSSAPRLRDLRAGMATLAWNHYCNQFAWTRGDRKPIVAQLKKLLAGPHGLDTKAHRNMIADMERTLLPVKTVPGSPEAELEALLESDFKSGWLGNGGQDGPRYNAVDNPHYKRLCALGLSAVPLLLRHRDDFRMTRHIESNYLTGYVWHLRIADVVAQLLNGLGDEQFAYDFLELDGRGVCLDAAHLNWWWKKMAGIKELDYLLKKVQENQPRTRPWLNWQIVQVLAARFPTELIKLVEKKLARHDELLQELVNPLAESAATDAEKQRLLLRIARGQDGEAGSLALSQLLRMHCKEAVPLLIAALDRIPRTAVTRSCQTVASSLAAAAIKSGNEKVWEALARTARRVDVNQRLQLLGGVGYAKHVKNRALLLRHLKGLLDDRATGAVFIFDQITVRDYAAMQFAELLDMSAEPDRTWKEADWTALRQRVRVRLAELENAQSKEKK